jgi:RNA polymerase sigma-54 factor
MKPSLSLRMSQQLTLTPQLQQSIRLLQLSTLEMDQEIDQMLEDNPFLEREEPSTALQEEFGVEQADQPVSVGDQIAEAQIEWSAPVGESTAPEVAASPDSDSGDREASPEADPAWDGDGTVEVTTPDTEWGDDAPPRGNAGEETASAADLASKHVTLTDHLMEQALGARVNPVIRAALEYLIGNLNEDGYLDDDLSTLASALLQGDESAAHEIMAALEEALEWLQDMEPAGVGARSLQECLKLQVLGMRNGLCAQSALLLVEQDMTLLAKRDIKRLSALTHLSDAQVREALTLIHTLEPKPGRRFANAEQYVIRPDVIVQRDGDDFKVSLNPAVMPRLRVLDHYATALKAGAAAPSQQRVQEARWFVKNIAQRFDTIVRVSSAIVMRQRGFFIHGEMAMRPMVLREIADELGLHESTVSRVTTAKYMATPWGTFELKYFFGSGLGTEVGGSASSTAVRALIKQLIAAESPIKPLSDNQLSQMLKEQGIDCARRTVAKYREAMRIAPANLRKAL